MKGTKRYNKTVGNHSSTPTIPMNLPLPTLPTSVDPNGFGNIEDFLLPGPDTTPSMEVDLGDRSDST